MKEYCAAVVLAAGQGKRMGTKTAKQFLQLGGLPVAVHCLMAFQRAKRIDEIILAVPEEQTAFAQKEIVGKYGLDKVTAVISGGNERYESVWNALRLWRREGRTDMCLFTMGPAPLSLRM